VKATLTGAAFVLAASGGLHERRTADLDGNDVLGKPYDFETPRLDTWLNLGRSTP
jgi:hypothetical protein